jgi:ketosteroid isomerase-like protein
MKRVGLVLTAIVGVALVGLGPSSEARAAGSAKAQITDTENKLLNATSTDQAIQYYDQKNIDFYDVVPPLQYKGGDAVRGDLDNFFSNAKDLKGKMVELTVITDGKLGVAYSIQHFTWTGKDGKAAEATLRVTDAYHKVDGQWKIFHSQVSMPVDFKTGMGQMNLSS